MCTCVGGCVCQHDKMKTPDLNDLKHGTIVVLDNMSRPVDFIFKRSRVRVTVTTYEFHKSYL